ncbi:hypothetical protein D3C76_1603670 [compost metagenome]
MRYCLDLGVQADHAIVTYGETQFVAMVEKLEHGFQLVIAIRAAADDMQPQVELGRGGQGERVHEISAPAGVAASP